MSSNKTLSLGLVLFIFFIDWMGIGLVYPMFSAMLFHPDCLLVHPNTSDTTKGLYLGILLASMPLAQFISGPICGAISDQKGRKPIFIFSLLLGTVGYGCCVLSIFLKSISLLIASRAIVGIAAGNAAVVSATIADLSRPETKAKYFGLSSMCYGLGFAIGPFLGGKLSENSPILPFLVAGLATFLNLLLIVPFFQETAPIQKRAPVRFWNGLENLKNAFSTQRLRTLLLTVLLFCFGWSFFYEFIPVTWIIEYGFSSKEIGLFYAYGAGFYALSSGLLIRPIVDRCNHDAILFYSLLSLGSLILLMLIQPPAIWIWIYLPIANFLIALLFPTSTAMISNSVGPEAQGKTLGVMQSIEAAAFAISPLVAGPLLGWNSNAPILLGGASMLIGSLILSKGRKT